MVWFSALFSARFDLVFGSDFTLLFRLLLNLVCFLVFEVGVQFGDMVCCVVGIEAAVAGAVAYAWHMLGRHML